MTTQIELVQKPVIEHKLFEVGKSVTARIEELNLGNLVATDDTIKSLKELRAELNKEFTEFENQRKALKSAVAAPYQEFETVYNSEISEKYKQAGELLKDKIGAFEAKVKADKEAAVKEYFAELTASVNIDFLTFKHTGIEVNLSTTEKKYKEECQVFVSRVQDDILLIQAVDYPAETMAEYKANGLNASKAITTIRDRKEAERLEKERIKAAETAKRTTALRVKNFTYSDLTKSYHWTGDESVSIEVSKLENMDSDEFTKFIAGVDILILEAKQAEAQKTTAPTAAAPITKPIAAPVEVKQEPKPVEKVFIAQFEVSGTLAQLKSVGEFLKANNITYKNI